jgi:MarR family transcriptional regulator, temperature-dependent positive regulator of motility
MANKPSLGGASAPRPAAAAPTTKVAPTHRVPAHLARRFHQICLGVLAEVTEPNGLTPLQYAVLAALDDEPGIDQRRLATRLGTDPVSTGQIVDRLEKSSWVDRRVDETDRRARVLRLTAAGTRLRRRLRPTIAVAHDRVLTPLSPPEQTMLLHLLTRVIESNESYARPGNGRRHPRKSSSSDKQAKAARQA